ncbi:MAG: YlmC/YmxH family sporulation protein [Firmicutes bacterium]|nr:YlmC/YmxH family sporulation protein [Bacillota bacterium]
MQRASELRVKEVVSINDGRRLGFMFDLEIDMDTGKVMSFVIPSGTRVLGFLGRGGELVIDWDRIKKIGLDVILVDDSGLTI